MPTGAHEVGVGSWAVGRHVWPLLPFKHLEHRGHATDNEADTRVGVRVVGGSAASRTRSMGQGASGGSREHSRQPGCR